MRPFSDALLAHTKRLLSAQLPQEILALTCQEVQRLTGVELVFGSLGTTTTWSTGVHQRFRGFEGVDVPPQQQSALFGVYRAVSRERAPVTFTRDTSATIVDALCDGEEPARLVTAFPVIHPRGRLSGCLSLCLRSLLSEDATGLVAELASVAALALENVQRISSARRDRERLNLLAEAAEEALWDWSPDTGEFWWGGGVQTLIGDVLVQSRLSWKFEQVHADDSGRVRQSFERALAAIDAETWHEEYRLRRTDGTWIQVEDHAHILRDSSGRAHRVVGAVRDVTQLRALLAREHAARAEAERANFVKDEFLAMLGHELRNPLSPILAALQLLRRGGGPEIFEKGLAILDRQARHLTRLVDDLLDVARITQGKVHLERDRIDLADVVDVALERANPLIEERCHVIETRISRGLWIDADRGRVEQVIGNLLTNAAKYTPPGGRIRVEARALEGLIQVSVADTGIGISPEMLPRVFDTFSQDRQSLDRSRGGLGLGLAIVRNLVQLHGGTVSVHSDGEGRGSEFVVRIPAAISSPAIASASIPQEVGVHGIRRRVLIVDDNVDAADSMAALVGAWGHVVTVARDALEALALAADFKPDTALVDIGLPGMNGYELARRWRALPEGQNLTLIAMTGYGRVEDRSEAREAGFDVHLVKPAELSELKHLLDREARGAAR